MRNAGASPRAGQALPRERKSVFLALLFNALLPGFGVAYALDQRAEWAGLPGWEWGLIDFAISIGLLMGNVDFGVIPLMNGLLAAVVTYAAAPTRRELHERYRSDRFGPS